jgi:hypothetical protein
VYVEVNDGANVVEAARDWRKEHSEELHYLYCSSNIIRRVKSRRIGLQGI